MRRRRTDSLHSSPFTFHPSLKPPSFVPPRGRRVQGSPWGRLRTAFFDRFCDFILLFVFRCAAENLRPPYMAALQSRRKISGQRRRAAIYRGRPPSRSGEIPTRRRRTDSLHYSLFSFLCRIGGTIEALGWERSETNLFPPAPPISTLFLHETMEVTYV